MMKTAAATAPPPSGFSCCHGGIPSQGPDTTAKDRWDGLVRRANASALLPPLAHLACPLLPRSRDIVGAALCCRSGPQVWVWGERHRDPTGGLGSPVFCCLRWPAGMWGHFFDSKSRRRWAARRGAAPTRARRSSWAALRYILAGAAKLHDASPSPHDNSRASVHLK